MDREGVEGRLARREPRAVPDAAAMQFPAPLLPPSPRGRGRLWLALVPMAVVIVVAVAVASRGSHGSSGDKVASATTVDRVAAACIARSLAEANRLAATAEAAAKRYRSTSWSGDASYLDYGQALSALDLTGCPATYRSRFQQYGSAHSAYGTWIEAHTGVSHALAGSDRTGMRTLQQAIVTANDLMMDIVGDYRPDLVRTIHFSTT